MKSLVIAPHPDDEVLGAGGTLLRLKSQGVKLAWVIVTCISAETGWREDKVQQRSYEISKLCDIIGFDEVYQLNFPTAQLDHIPLNKLVEAISKVFKSFQPNELFLPHYSDIHSDHRIVFDAVISCTKWFRYPFIKRIMTYETLSETEYGMGPHPPFYPNVFIDIEPFLQKKIDAIEIYSSEIGEFPFPRSKETIVNLAQLRGSQAGFKAAEAFQLLKERIF